MTTAWRGTRGTNDRPRWVIAALLAALLAGGVSPARADDAADAVALVDQARAMIQTWDPAGLEPFPELAASAKAVLIIPRYQRAGLVVGGFRGAGLVLSREAMKSVLYGPAFVELRGGSFGFQAGADVAEVIVLIMTERGVTNLLSPAPKFGVDLSATGFGAAARAETSPMAFDIVTFARPKGGLYAGVSVEGASVRNRHGLNAAYHGKPVTPTDILITGSVINPHADELKAAIRKLAGR